MMPDCTGLPPGLLMRRITPAVCLSSKAACKAPMTCSALASPLALMTPFRFTSAVNFAPSAALSPCPQVQRQAKHHGQVAEAEQLEEDAPAPAASLLGKRFERELFQNLAFPVHIIAVRHLAPPSSTKKICPSSSTTSSATSPLPLQRPPRQRPESGA
jgi:hypothetical protein